MHVEAVVDDPRNDPGARAFALASPEAAVVVATALSGPSGGCGHGTDWFLRRLGAHLLTRLTDRPDRGMADCLSDTVAETAALHGARCDLAHERTPTASVVACRVVGQDLQYLVLGPGVVLLHHERGSASRLTAPDGTSMAVGARPGVAALATTGSCGRGPLSGTTLSSDATRTPRARVVLRFRADGPTVRVC